MNTSIKNGRDIPGMKIVMNTSIKNERDIPGTLTFELTPTTKNVVCCFSTWAGEELECVKSTKRLNVNRPSKRRVYWE
jgi:hypothetical protein